MYIVQVVYNTHYTVHIIDNTGGVQYTVHNKGVYYFICLTGGRGPANGVQECTQYTQYNFIDFEYRYGLCQVNNIFRFILFCCS